MPSQISSIRHLNTVNSADINWNIGILFKTSPFPLQGIIKSRVAEMSADAGPCSTGTIGAICENKASSAECTVAFPTEPDVNGKRCLNCCQQPEYACSDVANVVPLSCADVKKKNLCNTNITLLMKQILKACPQTCGLCSVNDCNDLDSQFCTKNQASAITKISSYLCWNIAEEFAMPATILVPIKQVTVTTNIAMLTFIRI
ncbi:unnamed protein product [Dracunculus medinensis]|uniref:ShKT domain-containing protein n=1 Tax=Dracunculus medinensis TaxID=318479 RepID=A0A0N4UK61_DRAME|nr:unnamed protein product [Dracunculus medinensis]